MIDNIAIYFSCALVVYLVWRAALLDARLPWFKPYREARRVVERGQRGQGNIPGGGLPDLSANDEETGPARPPWRR